MVVATLARFADICDGIAVEDHEIGIKALLYPALLRGLEIARGAVWVIGVLIARAPICISDRFDRNISLAASALSIDDTETELSRGIRLFASSLVSLGTAWWLLSR
jgi:hypothetical protein